MLSSTQHSVARVLKICALVSATLMPGEHDERPEEKLVDDDEGLAADDVSRNSRHNSSTSCRTPPS